MIQSTITKLTSDGWQKIGVIAARDGELFYTPQDETLAAICSDPILGPDNEDIEPTDAEAFVKALSFEYSGSYLRASVAEEASDEDHDNAE